MGPRLGLTIWMLGLLGVHSDCSLVYKKRNEAGYDRLSAAKVRLMHRQDAQVCSQAFRALLPGVFLTQVMRERSGK